MEPPESEVLEEVRVRLRTVLGSEYARDHLRLAFADGVLTIEGEVESVAAKKRALRAVAASPAVKGVVDRLHVRPAQAMGDREIRDHLAHAFINEPAFAELALFERQGEQLVPLRASPLDQRGRIEITVADGIVTLDGTVPGLDYKRLAWVLAWWIPGVRDVVNGIAVEPPEEESDGAIADACRLVLEKDPLVNASQIRIGVRDRRVVLSGVVPTEEERRAAENDAWFLFGVDEVENRIDVHR